MKNCEINIRDPFVLYENGLYYMYGTRATSFGCGTGGFDVYIGKDLINWSEPKQIFYSEKYGLNKSSNWAPEVHKYNGKYYMLATFEQPGGNRGTYSLVSEAPDGEFVLNSKNALTPENWMSLDGTLFIENGEPYLVFCHEHVQIMNGTVCSLKLTSDLSSAIGEPKLMFSGSSAFGAAYVEGNRYVTDGPFLFRGKNNRLYFIWSTFINSSYVQCIAVSSDGTLFGEWQQLKPIYTENGGHGMVFVSADNKLIITLHSPNTSLEERPFFFEICDTGTTLKAK